MKKGDYQTKEQAIVYDKQRFSETLDKVHKDEIAFLKKRILDLKLSDSSIFLDLGAGTGRISKEILKLEPFKLYAVDPSYSMLEVLKTNLKRYIESRKLSVLIGRSDKIPLLSESIDIISCFHVFKHLPNIHKSLKEIARILKNGGFVIFDVLNKNSLIKYNIGDCYSIKEKEILSLLKANGFMVRDITYLHPLGETVYKFAGKSGIGILNIISSINELLGLKLGTKILIIAQKKK